MKLLHKLSTVALFVFMVGALSSCSDFLDRQDDGKLQESEVFNKYTEVEKLVTQLYSDMYNRSRGLELLYSHNIGTICDELEFNKADSDAPYKILNGELSADPASIGQVNGGGWWWEQYQSIRKANKIIWGVDYYNTPDHPSKPGLLKQRVAEATFFRAYFHYMLLRWHGEMVYMDRVMSPDEDPSTYAVRESVHTSVEKMCKDLDAAAADLPVQQSGMEMGRIDKGACLALKAIVRYIAAQPLYNGGEAGVSPLGNNDTRVGAEEYKVYKPERWAAVLEAAQQFFTECGNRYSLYSKYSETDFVDDLNEKSKSGKKVYTRLSKMFQEVDFYLTESILTLKGGKDTRWIQDNLPDREVFGGQTRNQPTQEQVDQYEYIVGDYGYSIFSNEAKTGGYDDENPYVNRDPRFYRDIIYPGAIYQTITYSPQEGGSDEINNSTLRDGKKTRTGYALRKFVYEDYDKDGSITAMYFPLIRLPEIMLIYAEALNETDNPDAGQKVYDLLNEIRTRSFMKKVPESLKGDKEMRREYINRERRVELFFENNRYFNLRYKGIPTSSEELLKEARYLGLSSDPDERAQKWIENGNGEYPQTQHYIHGMIPVPDTDGKVQIGSQTYKMKRIEGKQMVRQFTYRNYFFPINSNEIAKTPSLIQNPGW